MQVHNFYRKNGLRVHEIPVGRKCPVAKSWPDSTRTHDQVDASLQSPGFNKYGWILDEEHVVIDIDVHCEEENGLESLAKLEAAIGFRLEDACGAVIFTPSGGRHYYFSKPPGETFGKVFKDAYPGIDFISGKGMQVIAAGSSHDDFSGSVYTMTGEEELIEIPEQLLRHLQGLRKQPPTKQPQTASAPLLEGERAGDDFNTSRRGLELLIGELRGRGYEVRSCGDHFEFDRPGKSTQSERSGFLGKVSKEGNFQLTCFSKSDATFAAGESMAIFHAYALLCTGGDHTAAASELHYRGFATDPNLQSVDLSKLFVAEVKSDIMSEEDAGAMIPKFGILRQVFDVYEQNATKKSNLMGLGVALSLCETIFGRKITSHTDMRTNDYNVIVAPTTSGKEACEQTIINILEAADRDHGQLVAADVQSGNGLITGLSENGGAGLVISDEFGKTLRHVLDPKANSHHQAIGTNLLKLYGKSNSIYSGAAHSAGTKNRIVQPHLCVLGLSTASTLFDSIRAENVDDGLLGRIGFFVVQERPKRRKMRKVPVPEQTAEQVRRWIKWEPSLNRSASDGCPNPKVLEMTDEAIQRWESHAEEIDERMECELETRAAIWGRVAGRSMKLALVHRAARQEGDPATFDWEAIQIEKVDIDWGIRIANALANTLCTIIDQDVVTDRLPRAKEIVIAWATKQRGGREFTLRELMRAKRSMTKGDFQAAVDALVEEGRLIADQVKTGGRPKTIFKLAAIG